MRRAIQTDKAPRPIGPYSQGIVATGSFVYVAGQGCIDPATQELRTGTIEQETRLVLSNIQAILEAAGTDLAYVVKCNVYLQDLADFKAMNQVYREFFGDSPPARTTVQAGLLGIKVEIDAVAVMPDS